MISLKQQVKFIENKILKLEQNKSLLKNHKMKNFVIANEIAHLYDLLRVIKYLRDDKASRFAVCEMCGGLFLVKREKQNVCSGKCRTRLYRQNKNK